MRLLIGILREVAGLFVDDGALGIDAIQLHTFAVPKSLIGLKRKIEGSGLEN